MSTTIDIETCTSVPTSGSSAESASLLGAVDTTSYGTLPEPATAKGKDKSKADKKSKKAVGDALKLDMASERTFFKWFRTGMQIGAIGTFVFIALDRREGSPWGVATVAFAWAVGFALVIFGLYGYYSRRAALRTNGVEFIPEFVREHSPSFVVAALVSVVMAGLAYAFFIGAVPSKLKLMTSRPIVHHLLSATRGAE